MPSTAYTTSAHSEEEDTEQDHSSEEEEEEEEEEEAEEEQLTQFWIRTGPHPSTKSSASRFNSYYLRHAGHGSNAVILALNPPKFMYSEMNDEEVPDVAPAKSKKSRKPPGTRSRSRYSERNGSAFGGDVSGGKVAFKSWKQKEKGREWRLHLKGMKEFGKDSDQKNREMWAPVEIVEKDEEEDTDGDDEFSFALHKNGIDEVLVHKEVKGFVVCEWTLGYPQLFWLTDAFQEGKLPEFCQRVLLIREDFEVELA